MRSHVSATAHDSMIPISVLKLLKMAKGIRALLDTVMQALPQVGNLGLLFFLLFFIFAALGVEMFGRLGESFLKSLRGSDHQDYVIYFSSLLRRLRRGPSLPGPRGARAFPLFRHGVPHALPHRHRGQLERNHEGE